MKKVLTSLAVVLAFFMMGCPHGLPEGIVGPPVYQDGVPQDLHYEQMAMRTSEMAGEGEIPSDPHEAWVLAMQEIEDNGIRIIPKAQGIEKWEKFTTTFPTKIFVSKNWDTYDEATQAVILWHELVHVREYDAHTPLVMGTIYLGVAEARWALEVQAFRETFRVRRIFGEAEDKIRAAMRPRAERLYESYDLGGMPKEYAIDKAVEIWMLDSPNP
jgi:hypothetical protein